MSLPKSAKQELKEAKTEYLEGLKAPVITEEVPEEVVEVKIKKGRNKKYN